MINIIILFFDFAQDTPFLRITFDYLDRLVINKWVGLVRNYNVNYNIYIIDSILYIP